MRDLSFVRFIQHRLGLLQSRQDSLRSFDNLLNFEQLRLQRQTHSCLFETATKDGALPGSAVTPRTTSTIRIARGMRDWNSRRDHQSLRHRYAAINRQQDMSAISFRLFRRFCSFAVSISERARARVLSIRSSEGRSTPVARSHWAYRSRFSGVMLASLFTAFPCSQKCRLRCF